MRSEYPCYSKNANEITGHLKFKTLLISMAHQLIHYTLKRKEPRGICTLGSYDTDVRCEDSNIYVNGGEKSTGKRKHSY